MQQEVFPMVKKAIFLSVVLATISLTFAQEQEQGLRFGARAGLNLNSATLNERADRSGTVMLFENSIGFHVGAVADISISNFLYFQPGLMLTTKGMEYNSNYDYSDGDEKEWEKTEWHVKVYSIELPLMFSLKASLADNLYLRANVGPYLGFAFSGTFEYKNEYYRSYSSNYEDHDKSSGNIDIFPSDKDRKLNGKQFHAGLAVGGGIEIGSLYLGVNYDYGLTNLLDISGDGKVEAYERTLGFTLGSYF
jgi:hypothetical protein